jgi:hypothetical protein
LLSVTAPASDAVRAEWLRRVEAEYRSGAHAQHLTLWLMQLGAPPELVSLGLDVVRDELAHTELSAAVYAAAGVRAPPPLGRDSLRLAEPAGVPLEELVLRTGVEMFCLGETVAVRLFARLRAACTVEVAADALARIQADEVRHRDFGWSLLAWLLHTPMESRFRALLAHELPAMLARVRMSYGGLALARYGEAELAARTKRMDPAARAWGLMAVGEYVEAVDETHVRDYLPRFAELGIALPAR